VGRINVITMDADLDNPDEFRRCMNDHKEGFDLVSGWKRTGMIRSARPCPLQTFQRRNPPDFQK